MSARAWRVEVEPKVDRELQRIRRDEPRGIEAVEGLLGYLARDPLSGYGVRHAPGILSRPFHTKVAAYLVLYAVEEPDLVVCIDVRPVPYSSFE